MYHNTKDVTTEITPFAASRYIGGNAKARKAQRTKIAVYTSVEYKLENDNAKVQRRRDAKTRF